MATFQEGNIISIKSATDLSDERFFIVKTDSSGLVVLAAAETDMILGVLQNDPVAGEVALVRPLNASGTGKVIAGGSISKNDKLTSDSAGEAIATTTATHRVFGIALEAADNGDVFEYMPYTEVVNA